MMFMLCIRCWVWHCSGLQPFLENYKRICTAGCKLAQQNCASGGAEMSTRPTMCFRVWGLGKDLKTSSLEDGCYSLPRKPCECVYVCAEAQASLCPSKASVWLAAPESRTMFCTLTVHLTPYIPRMHRMHAHAYVLHALHAACASSIILVTPRMLYCPCSVLICCPLLCIATQQIAVVGRVI